MNNTIRNLGIVVIALLFLFWAYTFFKPPNVVPATQNQVQTSSGLIKVALDNKFKISEYQAEQFARQIKESAGTEPVTVVKTTGSEWEKMAKAQSKKVGADFSVVTDPKNPDSKPNPPKDSTVNLNQYNLFAYPKTLAVVGYSPNTELIMSYQWKTIKGKGFSGYIGPYGRADFKSPDRSSIGVMITITGH